MSQQTTKRATEQTATGGVLGPAIAAVGLVLAVTSGVLMFFTITAATTLVAGAVLLIGGLLIHRVTLNGTQQERDMTELMELMTDLN